jgi:preprotein translocase subunit SecA
MRVVAIPTNRPVVRDDATDYIYAHKPAKLEALVKKLKNAM